MNVLMIGSDVSAGSPTSPLFTRLGKYGEHLESLHVLILGKGSRKQGNSDVQVARNVWVHLRTSRTGVRSFWHGTRIANALIRTHAIDVVSAQNPFEHGWVAQRAIRGTSAKLHLQVHTDYLSPWFIRDAIYRSPRVRMPLLNRLRIWIADRIVPKADGVRVVSERIKESMLERYGDAMRTPSVIPIQVPSEVPPKVPLPELPFTFALMAVSRLEPEKRIPDLLAVILRLKDAYPALGLVLVGEGRERPKLERLVRSWGLENRVVFLGERPDAWGLMQSANAFIQASAYEGYGRTLIEAALAGAPIITSDVGIVGEVFIGYENVFAAPVGDPTNLAALTAQLIEDNHARALLAIEGKKAALAHLAAVKNTPADVVTDMARALVPDPKRATA